MCISGEYHSDNPEENNIISRYKYICRIEVIKFLCFLWPSKYGERPQCRGEPCIQCILILCHMLTSALRTYFRFFSCHYHLATLVTVVCRNSVSPPDLTGNAPVTDVLQPVQINLIKSLRNELKLSCLDGTYRRFCKLFHLNEPLLFYHWLYRRMTSVMRTYIMAVRYYFY